MKLAVSRAMANIIGKAARYTTDQSIRVFQRMLVTTMLMIAALGVFDGTFFSISVLRLSQTSWPYICLALLGAAGAFYLCKYQTRGIAHYEWNREKWRKGATSESIVADVLGALSDEYWIINDVTIQSGKLDHVVVGPTGVFAIETKNWRGLVTSNGNGELKQNGQPPGKPEVKDFMRRTMAVREQVLALTGRNDLFIKAVMVFPKARVEAVFGTTSHAHCVTDEELFDYIEEPSFSQQLNAIEIDQIVRAFKRIAGMDGFWARSAVAVRLGSARDSRAALGDPPSASKVARTK